MKCLVLLKVALWLPTSFCGACYYLAQQSNQVSVDSSICESSLIFRLKVTHFRILFFLSLFPRLKSLRSNCVAWSGCLDLIDSYALVGEFSRHQIDAPSLAIQSPLYALILR